MLIIPAIDLKAGECVRLRQGRMSDTTVFSSDPAQMAQHWVEQGAKRLHVVDLDGAFAGKPVNQTAIIDIIGACPHLVVQIGGGIRSLDTLESYLKLGAQYAIIGTMAVKEPSFVQQACEAFPGQIIVGIDAVAGKVAVEGWAKVSEQLATDLAQQFESFGVSAIVYTDIRRDGMLQGLNLEATQALAQAISIPVIASGGLADMTDIKALANIVDEGIMGTIAGRALYEKTLDLKEALQLFDSGH